MPKLKVLSGEDIIKIFESFNFIITGQKGSHVKLKRTTEHNVSQTLTISKHQELDKGTLKAIYTQALRYIPENVMWKHFYSE